MPFLRREARTASPDSTKLLEHLFLSPSSRSYDTAEKKESRWGKKEKVETENVSISPSNATNATERTNRWGKKEKVVETETETKKSDWSPLRVDTREEEEAKASRGKEKGLRQQLAGPQAKVVFHHFSADSAEDVLKVEGESAAPSLNTEYDVMIIVEVRYDTVLLFQTKNNR
jgi:hypothetical protein